MARFIFHCKCGHKWTIDYQSEPTESGYLFIFRKDEQRRLIIQPNGKTDRTCPNCGQITKLPKKITGHYNADHLCNDHCKNAVSAECHCACDGANHGIAWLYDPQSSVKKILKV